MKLDKMAQFMSAARKYHAAFEKTDSPARYVIAQMQSGGPVSYFALVSLHENWAGLEQDPTGMMKMMEEVYGRQDAEAIERDFNDSVESMESFILKRRPDLSYVAGSSSSNE